MVLPEAAELGNERETSKRRRAREREREEDKDKEKDRGTEIENKREREGGRKRDLEKVRGRVTGTSVMCACRRVRRGKTKEETLVRMERDVRRRRANIRG